uniref:NADH-ubiquinone oxidoreductase chain 6 n=1 Tax=Propylea japonica TaxID=158624 RepID=A0A0A0RUU1_9CUCU|nr:NADH dehydrogenase subunit 6 [Propylea japonica]UXW88427.1 NADH dehydrogenase subunit 6 [Propylea quattuordecimpunctata]
MLTMMMMMTSSMMIWMKHPLSLGLIILIHTILTCMNLGLLSLNFWYSYILVLVMIGGLLVIFIYMTSIASNEKFKFNKNMMMIILLIMFMMLMMFIMKNNYLYYNNLNNEMITNLNLKYNLNLSLSKFINFPNSNLFILIIFYLLIAMIAIVKISKFNYGPLRQLKYENTIT